MSDALLVEFARLERRAMAFRRGRELFRAFDELTRRAMSARAADAGEFKEDEHPRDEDGRFGSGGGKGDGCGGSAKPDSSDNPENNTGRSRNSAPVIELKGNELDVKPGDSLKDAAHRYYEDLRKNPVEREGFGKVEFTRVGRNKLDSSSLPDPERLKLLPAVPSLIQHGDYLGRSGLMKERKDGMVAFHYFEGNVKTKEGTKFVGISVGEDKRGNKFYNLTENSDALLEKKKARKSAEMKARGRVPFGDSASDASIEDEVLNLTVV
jgi:hypothetical protein